MLEWRDDKTPVSTRFDDPYFSVDNGRAETEYVFIDSNHLKPRWPEMNVCTIAELGFGTGLNFLETVRHWQDYRAPGSTLHFISFEQYPMAAEELVKALSTWQELDQLADILARQWDPAAKVIDTEIHQNVQLTVHLGDANNLLPQLQFKADAWYLDGFSPAKNPELWNERLMREVGKHTAPDGTFSTYTSAGFVKRGLAAAGFDVNKIKGFGRKREMLIGKMTSDIDVAHGH